MKRHNSITGALVDSIILAILAAATLSYRLDLIAMAVALAFAIFTLSLGENIAKTVTDLHNNRRTL